jgi:hypothetical protein
MATTLLLDRTNWDLCLDASGNIAVAAEPYALEQDVSSECRVFEGEAYYDTTIGIPYFGQVLGQAVPAQLLKERLALAAKRVPGVTSARAFLTDLGQRVVGGQVQFNGVGLANISVRPGHDTKPVSRTVYKTDGYGEIPGADMEDFETFITTLDRRLTALGV